MNKLLLTVTKKECNPSKWLNPSSILNKDRQFLELFAGQGEVTRALRSVFWQNNVFPLTLFPVVLSSDLAWPHPMQPQVNLRGAAIDLSDDPRCFDLTSPAGFVFLGFLSIGVIKGILNCERVYIYIYILVYFMVS